MLQGIGSFFVGTVVVGYAYQYFLSDEIEDRTVAKLDEVLERRIDRVLPDAARYGFAGVARGAPRNVFDGLRDDDELLWLDTYSPDLMLFGPKIREAVKAGASLRMLVIDPTADTARLRAAEIVEPGYDANAFLKATNDFLDYLASAASDLAAVPGTLTVRRYDDLPGIPMYLRLRDGVLVKGITGFFLSDPSFDAAHLCWTNVHGGLLASFHSYFENKWEQATPYCSSAPLE